jgi:hypothetical protein
LGQKRGLKNPWAREEGVFLVHPQNGLNGLILNWCIGGWWFTPAQYQEDIKRKPMRLLPDGHPNVKSVQKVGFVLS